jgi:hypothetical protein
MSIFGNLNFGILNFNPPKNIKAKVIRVVIAQKSVDKTRLVPQINKK